MSCYYPNDDAGVSVRCASVAAGVMRGANVLPGFIQPGPRGGRSPAPEEEDRVRRGVA